MFSNASSFNQPIGNWDVSKVIMYNLFNGATLLIKRLVTGMSFGNQHGEAMFNVRNLTFNQPIGYWDVSS